MRYIGFIFALCLSIQAIASNTLSLSSVSGTPQTEMEVVVSLDNTDAITALELNIPLGEHLTYVDGSTVLASSRSNGHLLTATQVQQELRICVYSLNLSALQDNSGELLSFRLKLGNEPATYTLTPSVILSDARGQSLDSDVQSGQVSILAPKLEILNPQIDYGHIPIRETYTQDLQLYNAGNLPLIIENIVVNDPAFTPAQTALTIEVGEVAYTTIHYAPTVRGAIQKEVVVTSNAINGKQMGTIVADPFSVNELHVVGGSGIADNAVTISLKMNNMEPIVGVQCTFVLPEQLEYIAGSLSASSRSNGHQALASVKKFVEKENQWYDSKGDTLVLMLYSMANQPLNGNDGEIATFQVRLNGNSGSYALTPRDVVLTNATAENMVSATYEGWVEIQSPQFSGDDYLSFGDWAITDDIVANYVVRNHGDAPLEIERVTFLAQGYRVVSTMPLQINPWEESTMQIAYDPAAEGDFSTTMNIYTNDPTTRMKAVAVSGHVYEPNTLSVEGERMQNGSYQLAISLDNYTNIVGVQYDIHWRSDMTTSQAAFTPTARLQNHTYAIMPIGQNTYRVLIYSLSNIPITGKEGELHQLLFTPQGDVDYCGDVLTIDNIVLSNANGTDKVSQSTVLHHLPTTQYSEQVITACDQYVYNNKVYQSSGTYIDTLQTVGGCDSIVTTYLTINRSEREEYRLTTCKQYEWHGQIYTETGDYEYHTTTEHGCERVEVLHLTISDREQEEFYETACEEYYWNGQTYTESGDYTFNTTSSSGCDRTEVLHLTIYKRDTVHYYETACNEYYWDHNWQYYYDSGDYEHYTTNEHGCERVEILHLTIHHSEREEYYVTTCNQYEWNGQVYTEPGDYEYYTTTEYGCERVEVLHLSFSDREYEEYYETACDQYEWHGEVYTESGDYTFNTISSSGCERTEVLHLTIFYSEHEEYNVTACDSYEWHGETYTESGDYEYRTTIEETTEKLYVGYDAQNDPIIGLTPPRGISRFTVDGFITEGSGACFVGTGTPVDEEADNSDLRIFDAGCFYYDRMSGRNACFFDDYRNPFNIEFGNYYAKNLETSEYYFNEGNNVYEYSNTEYPLTLFYNDYGKIHKVQFFDNNNLLWADINAVIEGGLPMIKIDYYEADGTIYHTQKFTENLHAETKTTTEQGCEHLEILHLTINKRDTVHYYETACDEYWWDPYGQYYNISGDYENYTTNEYGCERVEILHLTINRSEREEYYENACDAYEWYGNTYTESGDYEYRSTLENGCERIEVLHLTIYNSQYEEYWETACDEYWWNGNQYTESGDYTYSYPLYNWGTGTCDRTEVLHLTINKRDTVHYYETTCDEYWWDPYGQYYNISGDYEYYTTNEYGCERVEILHLTINYSEYEEYRETACDEFWWHDNQYTESGDYEYHTTLENGCQRVEVLHLTINRSEREEYNVTACDQYEWHGEVYTESGMYEYHTTTDQGCERVEVLYLTISDREHEEYYETACDEFYWDHNGQTYYESGDYIFNTTAANGCERTEVLHLTINNSEREEYYENGCDAYEWHGQYYYESGDYEYYTTTDQGCERVEVLHLTIYHSEYEDYWVTACDEYWWNGNQYTESGDYTYSYPLYDWGTGTCDRTEVLHLTINKRDTVHYYETACDEYWWNPYGQYYNISGDYENYTTNEYGCERVEILHLTINYSEYEEYWETACDAYEWYGNTYTKSGDYEYHTTTEQGCERVEMLHLTINHSQYEEYNITTCEQYEWHGETYTESGNYEYRTTLENGCERVEVLHLTLSDSEHEEYNITACDSYEWHGETYTESGDYEYRTTIEETTEKLYVGYDAQNDPIIGLVPPRGVSKFTVDGYITNGSGCCFVGTGSPENGIVDPEGSLRIFDAGCFYYDRMSGRNACFFDDYRNPFNIEFGNYYAKNLETSEYYFNEGNNVYEYSNTEYPLTLFYNDYGKIHKVQFFDNNNLLWADINAVIEGGVPMITIDYYNPDGSIYHTQQFTENLHAETKTITEQGCERVEILHLTINRSEREEYWENACDAYEWHGNTYTESGDYEYRTTLENGCERVEVLHLTIYHSEYEEYWVTACDEYWWHNNQYTESGEYTYSYPLYDWGTGTCDRTEVLHLTINKRDTVHYYETACDEYWWDPYGLYYNTSGDYEYYTTNEHGCERVEILHLTINRSEREEYWENACDAYEWHGNTYTESGDYEYRTTLENGCERVEVLHLTIYNSQYEEYWETACDEYWWNGNQYTESGDYTYSYPLYDWGTGTCDRTEVLHLTINKRDTVHYYETACDEYWWDPYGQYYNISGDYENYTTNEYGCERVEILHLTINYSEYEEYWETACDSYTWNGEIYTESGDYTYTTTAANGCDSIVTLHLTINESEVGDTEYATICYGETYTWNGQTYAATGEYSVTLTNAAGCDSIATLQLTIMPEAVTTTETVVIGNDELPYTWRGNTYLATGRYTDVEQYAHVACDSAIHVLDLTVLTTGNFDEESVTICETEAPYIWFGESYTTTGKYTYTEKYAGTDIDSVQHILNLTINPIKYTEETATACDSYTWNGETYTTSGDYTYTTTATNGCDSIVTLHLTINQTQYAEVSAIACDSFTWNGETYTTSGKYTYTTIAANGCDSIMTLHLTINHSEREEYWETACDEYWWHDNQYTESGDYEFYTTTEQGCERVEVLHLTILPDATTESEELALCPSELPYEWYGQVLTEAGTYSATEQYAGMECDSVIHELTLDVYVQTLPATVTLPIVRTGEAIDVSVPTAEIQAHIAAETWYAPNAEVAWYIMDSNDWGTLTDAPVAAGIKEVILKYAVETDCGNVESDKMVITVETTDVENIHSQSPISNCQKILYEDHIYILRDGKVYSVMGQEL